MARKKKTDLSDDTPLEAQTLAEESHPTREASTGNSHTADAQDDAHASQHPTSMHFSENPHDSRLHPQNHTHAYEQARTLWDERIGQSKAQARHWTIACLASVFISVLLLIALVGVISKDKTYVYIAKVEPGQTVANLQPIATTVSPTESQRLFFISQFVKHIANIPLDPVVLRQSWLSAYRMVSGNAINQLTVFASQENPFGQAGNYTQTVSIQNFHPVGQHTYNMTWQVTRYTINGQIDHEWVYNGSFTLVQTGTPQTLNGMLDNPFGLSIVYFNITKQG